jgi:DNA-binding transcriptional LysR family regulator
MDMLVAMRAFVRVAEAGGFTAVARELNTTQPTVSRTIEALERHLGTRLFNRSTRAVTLTEDGRQFYTMANQALEAVTEAENFVGRRRANPSGSLRLATPVAFGRLHVAPRLRRFLDRYPEIRIEMTMSDEFVDLIGNGIDLAIRIGEITDPTLIARRIGITRRVAVASPTYLRQRSKPTRPEELVEHDCVVSTGLATGNQWPFDSPEGPIAVRVSGRFLVDSSEGVREGVLGGLGIGLVPIWIVKEEVELGTVEIILEEFEPKRLPIHAIYPSRRLISPKVRAMVDFLAEEFASDPVISASADNSFV